MFVLFKIKVPSAEENLDEEMSDIDNRKRAGDSEVSCETVIQVRPGKRLKILSWLSLISKPMYFLRGNAPRPLWTK